MSSSDEKSKHDGENSVPFSKRAVKKAPSPKQDELKERRRKLFLKKVQDGREEKRYEVRGEDVCHTPNYGLLHLQVRMTN